MVSAGCFAPYWSDMSDDDDDVSTNSQSSSTKENAIDSSLSETNVANRTTALWKRRGSWTQCLATVVVGTLDDKHNNEGMSASKVVSLSKGHSTRLVTRF